MVSFMKIFSIASVRNAAKLLACALGAGAASLAPPVLAQNGTPPLIADAQGELSFEQLTSLEVRGVSKSVERALDAPASVTIVTSEEIRDHGFRSLVEILNVAPGFFGYANPVYGFAGITGFAPIDAENSHVLLLIDGFPVNDNLFEQALLGPEGPVEVSLIDRVEIIRGPGSSLYGSDAFFAVVNVITKNPSQVPTRGQVLVGSAGEHGASATYSGSAPNDTHYFLSASESALHGFDITLEPQSGLPGGARLSNVDAGDYAKAFAKIISGNLRVNLAFSEQRQQAGFGLHGDVLGDTRSFVRQGLSFADARYEGSAGPTTSYSLRASLAQFGYDAEIVDPITPTTPPGQGLAGELPAKGLWLDTEATLNHQFSREMRLIFGVEARRDISVRLTQTIVSLGPQPSIDTAQNRFGGYAQLDTDWSDRIHTTIGVRDDNNDDINSISPRFALVFKPSESQAVKLMAGSAFRTPSAFENYFAQPPSFLPSVGLRPERVHTLDLEYDAQLGDATRVTLTAFSYHAYELISVQLVDPVAQSLQYQNISSARAHGLNATLMQRLVGEFQGRATLSYTDATDETGATLQNAPRWLGRIGIEGPLPADLRTGVEVMYVGNRLNFDGTSMGAYAQVNASVSSPLRRGHLDWSLGIYNLLDRRYMQPLVGESIDAPPRTLRATAAYSF
jgi:outer membrane receptor protein involved in Fe transport